MTQKPLTVTCFRYTNVNLLLTSLILVNHLMESMGQEMHILFLNRRQEKHTLFQKFFISFNSILMEETRGFFHTFKHYLLGCLLDKLVQHLIHFKIVVLKQK